MNQDDTEDFETLDLPEPVMEFLFRLKHYKRSSVKDFIKGYKAGINNNCILLDSCSDVYLLGQSFGLHAQYIK